MILSMCCHLGLVIVADIPNGVDIRVGAIDPTVDGSFQHGKGFGHSQAALLVVGVVRGKDGPEEGGVRTEAHAAEHEVTFN